MIIKWYFIVIYSRYMYRRYNMSEKKRFKQFQCDYMIHIYSIPSQSLLSSPLNPKNFTSPNKTLNICVCRFDRTCIYMWYKLKNGNTFICVYTYVCILTRWTSLPFQSMVHIFYLYIHLSWFTICYNGIRVSEEK